jgi:hypothetical protein
MRVEKTEAVFSLPPSHEATNPANGLENKQGGFTDFFLVVFLPISFRCASKVQCCCGIEVVLRIRDVRFQALPEGRGLLT